MGNTASMMHGEALATSAVAKYMTVTQEQLLVMRDTSRKLAGLKPTVKRRYFQMAMEKAKIRAQPDQDILNLLFTMYDVSGRNRVSLKEFVAGVSILACRGETMQDVLLFAMKMVDTSGSGMIAATETTSMLRSMNATASYFGDPVLGVRQVYKIVDSVFDTMTLISQEADLMTHEECVERLLEEPVMQQILYKKSSLKVQFDESTVDPHAKSPRGRIATNHPPDAESVVSHTDVSSHMLSPLGRSQYRKFRALTSDISVT